jgi:hypothetical protein
METLSLDFSLLSRINDMCKIRQDEFAYPCGDCKIHDVLSIICLKEKLIEGIKKGDYDKANKAYEQMEEQLDG